LSGVGDDGKGFEFHPNHVSGVDGFPWSFGDHHRDRIADMADAISGKSRLTHSLGLRGTASRRGWHVGESKGLVGESCNNSGHPECFIEVGWIEGPVRDRASHEGAMQRVFGD
jgi:hypothetical protein